MRVRAYARMDESSDLVPFEFEQGPLGYDEVDVRVLHCGICHSDLSVLDNAWGWSTYPLVPGHEIVGEVIAMGAAVKHLKIGDRVGVGWFSESCMSCRCCMSGEHNLCADKVRTIAGRFGGFAEVVRCQASWAIPIPPGLRLEEAGPLLCGGAAVFAPLLSYGVRPVDRVAVIGIGGLGHIAIQMLKAWGCHVTAFTSSPSKVALARELGAHECDSTLDGKPGKAPFDFILATTGDGVDWSSFIHRLAPNGRLHFVGIPSEPVTVPGFPMISSQRQLSASPVSSPVAMAQMFEFVARHDIRVMCERFTEADINAAIARARTGNARFRVVVDF